MHELAVSLGGPVLGWGPVRRLLQGIMQVDDPVDLFGVRFPNRIGLAAGFDKNARFYRAAAALGFGHVEVGTVTPLPQPGHPRPRIWRLPEHECLRNKMGFPNDGSRAILARLKRPYPLVLGVNVGKQASTPLERAHEDYVAGVRLFSPVADYLALNVSSPNTAGLRSLAGERELRTMLEAVLAVRGLCPLLVKLSPDMTREELADAARVALDLKVDGLIATNTTSRRDPPFQEVSPEGGLSGRLLTARSREVVAFLADQTGGSLPLVGVGGVHDEESARAMLAAGASLVQVYTGFVYEGPGLARRLGAAVRTMGNEFSSG